MRIPGAEEALTHVGSWARRGRWKEESARALAEHFAPVCAKAGIDEADLTDLLGEPHYQTIQGCAFEDFLSRRFGPKGRNIIDDYLDQRGWQESIQGRDYLRALRDSVQSLYEVIEVKPGLGLVLRDLVRGGEPIEVDERLGSQNAVRWDRLAARVLSIAGRHHLSGALLHFPNEAADAVLRILRESPARAKRALADQLSELAKNEKHQVEELLSDSTIALEAAARIISWLWLANRLKQLKAPRPTLTNFDGQEVVFAKVRFTVRKESRTEVARLLDGAVELSRETEKLCWNWRQHPGDNDGPKAESGLSLASWDETGALVLGQVELRGKWLVLEVNSLARADRGKQMLSGLLGGLVGAPITETQSVESAIEERRGRRHAPAREAASALPPAQAAQAIKEFLDRHYRRVINEPLPALGNVSPRVAVSTPEGREKVIGWLKFLENGENRRAQKEGKPYDFTWMWRQLGVLEERR